MNALPFIVINIILLCVIFCYLVISYKKKNSAIAKLKELENKVVQFRQEQEEREKQIAELDIELKIVQKQYQDTLKNISEGQIIVDNLINNGREIAEKQLKEEFQAKREVLVQDLESKRELILRNIEEEKIKAQEELTPLQEELKNLTAKKEATIMALKREQERKNNLDFHRICLSKNDINDIGYLKEILDKLSNRTAIAKIIYETYLSTPVKELMMRIVGADKKSGIYRISDIETEECYIGQAANLKDRITQHIKGSLGIQTIADQRIHHAMDEKGVQNWYFEVLEECDKSQLNDREKYWINYYKSNELGFNATRGGARSGT